MELDSKPSKRNPTTHNNGNAKASSNRSLRLKVLESHKITSSKLKIVAVEIDGTASGDDDIVEEDKLVTVNIEGVWAQNSIFNKSIIHLLNPHQEEEPNTFTIDNQRGILVVDPDSLLTCTLVASSLFCERKTWLNNVFTGQAGSNKAMMVGTLVHETFQHGLKHRIVDIEKLNSFLDEQLDDATLFLEAYSVEQHIKDIRDEAVKYISSIKEWIEKFMLTGPAQQLTNDQNIEVKVVEIKDIEENVWSTKYGLKGKIDVTGIVRVHDKLTKKKEDKIIPLELKTGNPNLSQSHAAQVSLYSMMIEDRYAETNQGFVIYLKDKAAMHNVPLTRNIKRDLVQRRNQINHHLKSYYRGPEMLDQPRLCKGCDRLTECVLMSNIYEPGKIGDYPSMKLLEAEAIGHLSPKFIQFFKEYHEKLVNLMTKTESVNKDSDANAKSGSFWNYSSEEAEKNGTGFGQLQAYNVDDKMNSITFKRHKKHIETWIPKDEPKTNDNESDSDYASQQTVKKQKILDYFKPTKKSNDSQSQEKKGKPFSLEVNLSRCRLAISLDSDKADMDSQNSSTAIAIGVLIKLETDHFVVKLFDGAMDVIKQDRMYRIDKIEKRTNLDIERAVLDRLTFREDWRCDRVRQFLTDPAFEPIENLETEIFIQSAGFEEIEELDEINQKIVIDAISTDNYYVINEETQISRTKVDKIVALMSKVMHHIDKSVLIIAQNVDDLVDVMRYLQNRKLRFIIIDDGRSSKARYQYGNNIVKVPQNETFDLNKKFDLYIRQHEMAPVVLTSYAMSIGGLQFTRRTFDYCICYDTDQVELLVGLSPMFISARYILIDIKHDGNNGTKRGESSIKTLADHTRSMRSKARANVVAEQRVPV